MSKINIDTFSYENSIDYVKTSVDAILIVDGAADRYKVLSKSGIFTDFIDDSGRYKDLIESGTMQAAKEKGLVRQEGKEYVVQDGDVILFKFNV